MASVLIIDDDRDFCSMLSKLLTQESYRVVVCRDPKQGLEAAVAEPHDIVLLDIMMPDLDGLELLRRLRAKSNVHVIMLTAKGEEMDRVVGLELGADDYLGKPFHPRELIARIRAVLRRTLKSADTKDEGALRIGDLQLDSGARTVKVGDAAITLTSAEFDVLYALLQEAGRIVSREKLAAVLGRNLGVFDRTIDMHVSNLRRKLGLPSDGSERIRTIRSAGYLYAKPKHANRV